MPALNFDLRYLRWIVGHIDELEAIMASIQQAQAAPTWKDKILALRPILSALADIMDDFPVGFGATAEDEPEFATQVQEEASARGINWERLLAIAEKLLPIILMFLEPKPE